MFITDNKKFGTKYMYEYLSCNCCHTLSLITNFILHLRHIICYTEQTLMKNFLIASFVSYKRREKLTCSDTSI